MQYELSGRCPNCDCKDYFMLYFNLLLYVYLDHSLIVTVTYLRVRSYKLYRITESQPYYGKSTWDEANDYCQTQNDTLVKIHDLRKLKHLDLLPIWSSIRGKFTPWIAYRGTFKTIMNINFDK